jgi:predicted RNA-binding protein with PUA-like domain
VAKKAYPDPTAFDLDSPYYDPKSTPLKPRWFMVDVRFEEKFATFLELEFLKTIPDISDMLLFANSRLSVQPVSEKNFKIIAALGGERQKQSHG